MHCTELRDGRKVAVKLVTDRMLVMDLPAPGPVNERMVGDGWWPRIRER